MTVLSVPWWQRAISLAILLILLTLVILLWHELWWQPKQAIKQQHQQLTERLARYQGIIQAQPQIAQRLAKMQRINRTNNYLFTEPSPTVAVSRLQGQVRQLVNRHQGRLISTQVLTLPPLQGLPRVGIQVQMSSGIDALSQVFYELEMARPLLFIDQLQVMTRRIRRFTQASRPQNEPEFRIQLITSFQLYGFMPSTEPTP